MTNNIKDFVFLFDLDGTLVLTDEIYFDVWKEILQKYNIVLTEEIFKYTIIGNNDFTVINELLPLKLNEINEISSLKDELFFKKIDKIKIIEGAISFLKQINNAGGKMAIVTNCNRMTAEYILNYTNMKDYFQCIVVGNECSKPKPYPEPYLKAMELLQSENTMSIIFEDSKTGLLSAKSTNSRCIVGVETLYSKDELHNYFANITIKDYTNIDVEDLLNCSNNNAITEQLKTMIIKSLCFPIKDVEIKDEKLKGGFISDVIQAQIIKKDDEVLNCVIKLENKNTTFLTTMSHKLDLYNREYYFYETISKYVPLKIPTFYGTVKDDELNNIGIVMQNLSLKNYQLNLDLNKEPLYVSLKIIDEMVLMHSKYWNKPIMNQFKELKKNNDNCFYPFWKDFIVSKWTLFKQRWLNILCEKQMEIGEFIVSSFDQIQNGLSDTNLTLIHGDIKSANIFYDNEKNPYFIDWQYIANGKGVQDLVFFMIESFSVNKMKQCKLLFKEYYYNKILEQGIQYKREDYERDFLYASYFVPFTVAVWFGTIDQDELIDKNFPLFFIQKLFSFYLSDSVII